MALEVTHDGFFVEIWSTNERGEQVFPHLRGKPNTTAMGFDITLSGKKSDYHLVGLDELLDHLAKGHFNTMGRIGMKPRTGGGQSTGFIVRTATFSDALTAELESRGNKTTEDT